jgi:hypothetical protein
LVVGQTRAKNVAMIFTAGLLAVIFVCWVPSFAGQVGQNAPCWANLSANTAATLKQEGIGAEIYNRLLSGQVVTQRRCVPSGKSGVHLVAFGIVCGNINKLWSLLENCGQASPIMPYLRSCRLVQPDRPLAANKRWELLKIEFHMLFFAMTTTMLDEDTLYPPHYLTWRQLRGDAKINEGYFRIISLTPNTQLVVYDLLVDPGNLLPLSIKAWIIQNTLPQVITALREHI